MVEVIWHGHACFELRSEKHSIIFDPFKGIGLPEPKTKCDIVLCSHSHRDHNNTDAVKKESSTILEGFTGEKNLEGIQIKGIESFHDSALGLSRGKNSIYIVKLDGLFFCHLGDLGHDLNSEYIKKIGCIDVLFVPIGGGPTIGPDLAFSISKILNPKVIVPMHYNVSIPGMLDAFHRFNRVDDFSKFFNKSNLESIESSSFKIIKEELPKEQKIFLLKLIF